MSRSVLEFQLRLFDEYVQQQEEDFNNKNTTTTTYHDPITPIGDESNSEKQTKKNDSSHISKKQIRKKRDEKKHAKESLSDKVKKDASKKLNIYKENVKIMKRKRKQLLANKQSQLLELLTKK
ncbi:hypothetical protein FDP41_004498 [Naegleria fowleri]|uniref:Uncharacterized protein n=1 Tax=Naegleria fowleri TaxID=5763 RepID=A0A6A5BUL3_NAEFO|nr:uncharacterized protein FDP41_004498 [Naegleria fowleri]KAF0976599.1 hypothetical protein FDP41_004498 [Naegleria fowleri]